MDESEILPYEGAEISGERILVLAAHPDDDVFGAGGLIWRLAAGAQAMRTVVFTGGEAQEERPEGSADPRVRRDEAIEAEKRLGVSDVALLDFPDRGLAPRRGEVRVEIARHLDELDADLVLCPSPAEALPDHRALAAALYDAATAARPEDPDFARRRLRRLLFYEVSAPLLPNRLVPLSGEAASAKRAAMDAFASQAAVRDYRGAMEGLNAFRGLTLSTSQPAEAFYEISVADALTRPLAELSREIGPGRIEAAGPSVAPVGVVVRTKNRPVLLREALGSLAGQNARPRSVVVVNDGGALAPDALSGFSGAFELVRLDHETSLGRSRAANAGAAKVAEETLAFLDDDDVLLPDHFERLFGALRAGPEPVVYSDALTVVLREEGGRRREIHRELQYSLDFDPDYLLLSNYIPLHAALFDAALFRKAGGFDPELSYSEDWDLLIRLSREAPFRHVRAVTAHYRVFEGEEGHEGAGGALFQEARRRILDRYRDLRTDESSARVLDRLAARIYRLAGHEYRSEGELAYQRASHRRLASERDSAARRADELSARLASAEAEREAARSELAGVRDALTRAQSAVGEGTAHIGRLYGEIERLNALIRAIESTKAMRLHRALERFRGRR